MRMLINARNRTVAIEGSRIVPEAGKFDIVLDCRDADVRPGLINAHDHLHRNHYGRLGVGPYANAYRWAEDIQLRYRRRIQRGRRIPRRGALLAGAWKNLFAGVTTVVHHDKWEAEFDRDFPIRVARIDSADSLGLAEEVQPPSGSPFSLHVAEGVDEVAAGEVDELDRRGLLNPQLLAVHAVGVHNGATERFARSGAALIWCPTSNHFLFGRTTSRELLESGCDVLLGSDSRLTGAGDLLDELRAARALRMVDDETLEHSVGRTAARRLGIANPSLEPGNRADLILLGAPITQARSQDVALVIVDGVPRVARVDVAARLGPIAERGKVMRIEKTVRWTNQSGENA
jgi:cytosine/adenosine deaminase-related metal-dependent hydrolase